MEQRNHNVSQGIRQQKSARSGSRPGKEERWYEQVGPLTILKRGNSDPFKSVAIDVTPRVNEILLFFKNNFLPAIYQSDSETHYRSFSADSAWSIHCTTLYEECSAQSWILIGLTIMGNLAKTEALEREQLVLKGKLFSSLRARIEKSTETDQAVLDSVMFLFAAESYAGNFDQAAIHGQVLRRLFRRRFAQKKSALGLVEQTKLTHAMYYDSHLSLSNMSLPIFTLDEWIAEILNLIFQPLDQFTKALEPSFATDLDASLEDSPLRPTFIQVRMAVWLWMQPKPINDDDRSALSLWVMGRTHISKAMLVKHYLDLRLLLQPTLRNHMVNASFVLKDEHLLIITQSCLTLALLLFFMSFGGDPRIEGRPLLQICRTLSTHLQAMMSLAMTEFDVNSPLMRKYQNAHLWALFLGAQTEEYGENLSLPDLAGTWFRVAFGILARQMGLSTWKW